MRVAKPGFQKAAAQAYSWGARALYLGPALNLTPHRNAVACLALGLDVPFGVANDPENTAAGYRRCRSALILPNTLHHLAAPRTMAFLYLDACSLDLERLSQAAATRTSRAAFDLSMEAALLEVSRALWSQRMAWPVARQQLSRFLSNGMLTVDRRVRTVLDVLHADIGAKPGLAALACRVHLSESRLRRLFKAATGVPLSRYRLWIGMGAAMRAITAGETLTVAALQAGFASSAHFSAAYREMFGLEPSRLVKQQLEWQWDGRG